MTIVELLGRVLLHFVWQGAIIALALAVLLALTREAQARLRYLLSCAALVLMLGAALATATRVRTIRGAVLQADAPVASGPSQVTPLPAQDAQGSETTPVVTAPDTAGSLAARWTWAEGAARTAGRRIYWIGYTVSPIKTLPPFIYSHRGRTVS
jgi:hypothetical protein